ncbi:uncharacterized protein LOC128559221, partial [Mercenaria mercenaria]|uniref:uncharacterized protein LOC128559221 n=1 Tax=Mercenaria mercenaria TaxID=6596 RepID=UPI00234F092E
NSEEKTEKDVSYKDAAEKTGKDDSNKTAEEETDARITSISSPVSSTTPPASKCESRHLSRYITNNSSNPGWANLTTDEKIAHIVAKLRVDKTKLSATVRKKTSAKDDRLVSRIIGYIAVVLMGSVPGCFVVLDGITFLKYITKKNQISPGIVNEAEIKESVV